MIKNFICLILFSFILIGCSHYGRDIQKFPSPPEWAYTECGELDVINNNETKLSNLLLVVTDNYSKYYECRLKVDMWIEWYNKQKKNYESVK